MMATSAAHSAFIGLGSNIDCPVAQIAAGLAGLGRIEGTQVIRRSSLYRTRPVGYADQPDFVNAVAQVQTALAPAALLHALLALEQAHGRVRTMANGPRTLDLDVLLFDAMQIDSAELIVPHPRMHERAFVLIPLFEIAPQVDIPGRGAVWKLLEGLDRHGVERIEH